MEGKEKDRLKYTQDIRRLSLNQPVCPLTAALKKHLSTVYVDRAHRVVSAGRALGWIGQVRGSLLWRTAESLDGE